MFTENFVPVQRKPLRVAYGSGRSQFAFPNYLPGQLLGFDPIVHFVIRQIFGTIFIVIVGLHRNGRRVAGKEPRDHPNARHVHRKQTESARPGQMLVGGEIFEVEARRNFLESHFSCLRAFELERFTREQAGFECDFVPNPKRKLAFECDSLVLDFRFEILRRRRD